ncbi:MAG: NAD(P)/FAD-dependent oxidoreductase [Actinomycetota bacterium]|nr:NAD(P)/FAD-dependent oxidoreductase [Actinomycetota bacterium]
MPVTAVTPAPNEPLRPEAPDHEVLIVGNGFSGLGMAIKLKQNGVNDFLIIDKADSVAGTWRENTYPGCACDVPSHMYSYSFEPNPDWSQMYAPQPEIRAYLERCADKYRLRDHLVLGVKATGADWDEAAGLWRCRGQGPDGEVNLTARFLVSGIGGLHVPAEPDFPGIENFEGTVFHSAKWNHDYDLGGKRVAVVGTGASAIQFVPEIQPKVAQLDLYQRTAPWVLPKLDRRIPKLERALYRRFPSTQRAYRVALYWFLELVVLRAIKGERFGRLAEKLARTNLERQVGDPVKRRKLTPNYEFGCKRMLMSNSYYRALDRPNSDVITDGIAEIRAHSIVDGAGVEREVDAIILGTGFDTQAMATSVALRGVGGKLLGDEWTKSGIQAHRGTMVAGYPNLFVLLGPNTGLGHNSVVFMIERQIELAMKAISEAGRRGPGVSVAPTPSAQRAFNERVQSELRDAVWSRGTCQSWYLDSHGRNITLWPGATWQFRNELSVLRPDEYDFAAPEPPVADEHQITAAVAA